MRTRGAKLFEREMHARNMNQKQFAKFLGLDEARVSRLLRGLATPSRATVLYLREKLGIESDAWAPRKRSAA